MTGLKLRLLCVQTLMRAAQQGSYGNLALHAALAKSELTPQEKRTCTVLFQGTTERLITLDACIEAYAKRKPEKLDLPVLCVLRCGFYELLYMNTQEAAVVNLWTEAVKSLRKASASGMVNAVLRGFLRSDKEIPIPKERIAALSVTYSVPQPLVKQLLADYDESLVTDFLAASIGEPPIYLRRNPLRATEEELLAAFPAESLTPIADIPCAYRLARSGNFAENEAFAKGWFHVQDLASQLCAMALGAKAGDTVLDVCAAPGGKTFTIAEQMQNQGTVLAYDLHANRVKLIAEGAEKLGLSCIHAMTGDAANPAADRPTADCVLCDVPCSGFGVIRRKPEVRYKSLEDVAGLPAIQAKILAESAKSVKAGGTLVYSTCTLSKAENENVVRAFLAENPGFTLERPWQDCTALAAYGQDMTTLTPACFGSDGFFLAKMRRREA